MRRRPVWILSEAAVLSAAIGASLAATGWQVAPLAPTGRPAPGPPGSGGVGYLVLVADGQGRLPDPQPALGARVGSPVVAVVTRAAWPSLIDTVDRLATTVAVAALDADQPFVDLIRALDLLLRPGSAVPDPARLLASLRERDAQAHRFAELTRREQDVLCALLAGRSAAEIAAEEVVSMPTVRSHIRGVLMKLNVSSQLAAVALALRSCRENRVVEQMRRIHQF